mgnify:CR=1 FL=1
MSTYNWIRHNGEKLRDVGVRDDGTLYNPNGYDEQTVREAVKNADERRAQKRRDAAQKAAETRRRRREKNVKSVARTILTHHGIERRNTCAICSRNLSDEASIARGVGSECWQDVLKAVEKLRREGGK